MQRMTEDHPAAAASAPRPWSCTATSATGPARQRPHGSASCTAITDDYPAAAASCARRWSCSATSATGAAKADALDSLGTVHALYRGLPGRRRLPPAGAGAVPRHRPPAGQGRAPSRSGCRAAAGRGLPGGRRRLRQALELFRDLDDRFRQAYGSDRARGGAAADRRLPGRRRQQPAGPQPVPRPPRTPAARPTPSTSSAWCSS